MCKLVLFWNSTTCLKGSIFEMENVDHEYKLYNGRDDVNFQLRIEGFEKRKRIYIMKIKAGY